MITPPKTLAVALLSQTSTENSGPSAFAPGRVPSGPSPGPRSDQRSRSPNSWRLSPRQRSSIIQPEGPVGEVPVRLKDLSPPILPEPDRRQEARGNRYATQINAWIGRRRIRVALGRRVRGGAAVPGRRSILIND